jgi:hypothetical protein
MRDMQQLVFVSALQTGTGAAQNIPHNLGTIPSCVFVVLTDSSNTFTQGTHTALNIVETVTLNATFKVVGIINS